LSTASYARWCRYTWWIPAGVFFRLFGFPKNLIFIWVPKSAGTSVAEFFGKKGFNFHQIKSGAEGNLPLGRLKSFGYQTFGHLSLDELVRSGHLRANYVKTAILLTVIRNPEDRFLSLFFYYKKLGILAREKIETPAALMEKIQLEPPPPPGLFNWKGLSQCRPQVEWLPSGMPNKMRLLDFAALPFQFQKLCKDLKMTPDPLPHTNRSPRASHLLDFKTRNRIADYYQEDLRLLSRIKNETAF